MRVWQTAGLACAMTCATAGAQSLTADEVLSSITVTPVSVPNPVRGADGQVHLAYELAIANPSQLFVTLDKVEIVDAAGAVLESLDGDALGAMITQYAGKDRMLPAGGTALVFLDVRFASADALPEHVQARVTATRQATGPDGKPAPLPPGTPVPATYTFTGAPTEIGAPARLVAPPLRGANWMVVNGCCDAITSHRGAVLPVNGRLRIPERFAIDFIRLDAENRVFSGDVSKLESYAYYGTEVHAVADGTVVNLYNGADEQIPGADAKGITTENIGGNMIVVDIGGGAFAFYAHLQRDSLKVKLGDTVTAGQVLGLLGNTGNSTAPHLHFHLMDGPSPLDANGLPYVFGRFTSAGVIKPETADAAAEKGTPMGIDGSRLAGAHADELPLNGQVVSFD